MGDLTIEFESEEAAQAFYELLTGLSVGKRRTIAAVLRQAGREDLAGVVATELQDLTRYAKQLRKAQEKERKAKTRFGLFKWKSDGRYPESDALKIYKSEKVAQKAADKLLSQNIVVRTIMARVEAASPRKLADKAAGLARFLIHPKIDQRNYNRIKKRVDALLDKLVKATGTDFGSIQEQVYDEAHRRGASLPLPGKDI